MGLAGMRLAGIKLDDHRWEWERMGQVGMDWLGWTVWN